MFTGVITRLAKNGWHVFEAVLPMKGLEEKFEGWWNSHYKHWREKRKAIKEEYYRCFVAGADVIGSLVMPLIRDFVKPLTSEEMKDSNSSQ